MRMHRDAAYSEFLERRFGYHAWKTPPAGGSEIGLPLPAFAGTELPGWTLRRTARSRQPDGTPLERAIWVGAANPEQVLDVEMFERDGLCAAREYVLTLLGDMQGAAAQREPAESLGDVAFRLGNSAVVFARRNIVVRIRNAGSAIASGIEAARMLDDRLTNPAS
jgi:hypothetical protein